jgi:hypothetical protein
MSWPSELQLKLRGYLAVEHHSARVQFYAQVVRVVAGRGVTINVYHRMPSLG